MGTFVKIGITTEEEECSIADYLTYMTMFSPCCALLLAPIWRAAWTILRHHDTKCYDAAIIRLGDASMLTSRAFHIS